jgi:hypothetical protein
VTAKDYIERIHELPCVICWKRLGVKTYGVHAHHVGTGMERDDFAVVALCPEHHQGATGVHGLHRRAFESMWKTSPVVMLAWTNEANCKF